MMDIKQRQEQFSKAYIRAIASVAGYATYEHTVDDDSIDLGISSRGKSGSKKSPRLEIQLKCPYRHNVINPSGTASYVISTKNYDDLRDPDVYVPRILVVVVIPRDISDWIDDTSDQELLVRHCAYWASLRGRGPSANTKTVTVNLPSTNLFTVNALKSLMDTVAAGGAP